MVRGSSSAITSGTIARSRSPSAETSKFSHPLPASENSATGVPTTSDGVVRTGYLFGTGNVDAERIFLVEPESGPAEAGAKNTRVSRVDFALR
jgi:hypothetical protein